jgi:L-ribulose-5-phosphate 4-epimerase
VQAATRVETLREQVGLGCRILGAQQHGDLVWGHVSVRDPGDRGAWMKASTWGFEEVDATRTLLVSYDGDVVEGGGRRHAEYPIHTEILRARADVSSVVHTHAPHAVAFAATGSELLPVSHEGSLFTPPGVPQFEETGDLILSSELGQRVARSLGDHHALFLVNHGIVTVGPDVPTAVMTAVLLERACAMQLRVMAAGGATRWSEPSEARSKRQNCYAPELLRQAWDYLVRQVTPTP